MNTRFSLSNDQETLSVFGPDGQVDVPVTLPVLVKLRNMIADTIGPDQEILERIIDNAKEDTVYPRAIVAIRNIREAFGIGLLHTRRLYESMNPPDENGFFS
jgi:hypothetical protein